MESSEVLEKVLDSLHITLEENQAVVASSPLPQVRLNEVHLQQIFQNLLGNALKYRRDETAPQIYVSAIRDEDMWRFSVADNGIGIAPAHQAQVFGIFKRLHAKGKYAGTGIGLAHLSKDGRALRRQNLDRIRRAMAAGSTFHFTIPAAGNEI